jgi:hypothetical protein
MRVPGTIRLLLLCAVGLGIAAAAPQLLGTAFAQSSSTQAVQAFSRAVKAYEDGDWNAAAGFIDEAMQAGLPKDLSARAIHLRAHINEHSGALARALQDYSTALWMDTLPQIERKAAQDGKLRVIAAMGLNSSQAGVQQASAAPGTASQDSSGGGWSMFGVFGSSKPAAAVAPPPPPAPEPAPQSSSGGVWNMYGIFGSSTTASPAPEPAAPAALAVQTQGAKTSASGVLTRPKPAEARAAKAAPAPKPAPTPRAALAAAPRSTAVRMAAIQPAAAPAASAGGFMILFGSAGSESAGQSRAHQIKAALADILVNRDLEVEAGAAGGYQIVAGPYKAKSAALAVCSAIKQRGVSCQVTP